MSQKMKAISSSYFVNVHNGQLFYHSFDLSDNNVFYRFVRFVTLLSGVGLNYYIYYNNINCHQKLTYFVRFSLVIYKYIISIKYELNNTINANINININIDTINIIKSHLKTT